MNEDFESWWETQDWAGMYEPNKHSALIIWQASRESLVVDLPKAPDPRSGGGDYHYGLTQAIDNCREAIHAAGVKTR